MTIVALSPTSAPIQWQPERLRTEQHEWGVAIATEATCHGDDVHVWINEQRSKGWGRVMEFHSLRLKVAWRMFGELPRRNDDQRWSEVDAYICDEILTCPNNGLVVVPVNRCGTCE